MSYASRLVAMSRGSVPVAQPRVVGGDAEPPREEVVETELRAPRTVETPSVTRSAAPERVPASAPVDIESPLPHAVPAPVSLERPARRENEPAAPRIVHETVEHHTIVPATPPRPPAAIATPPAVRAPVMLPPQAQWLAEDTEVADPLVASAETDTLRELMRNVRQWTSSTPQVIEQHDHAAPTNAPAVTIAAPPAATQVSIGNVTVTVEDVPPARTSRAAAPGTTSDRLARNHIRGG